ncbi:MAG: lamin tail domain-containing protein [Bacteroidetes bacterium]|nr:lamin tail domain-containing protein [Bacteroidota bacterium]
MTKLKFTLTLLFFVVSISEIRSQTVINELMYAPVSPNKEWFELYNSGTDPVNIQNWKWRDAAATNPIRTITTSSVIIPPNSFALICEDTANVRAAFPGITGILLQSVGWNALNNSGNENLVVYNSTGATVDSLTYTNSWGGSSGGYSLERRIPTGPTNDQANWGTSIDPNLATPDRQNSLTPKPFDLILKSFTISPLFPVAGQTLNMNFVIKNIGINTANNFSLNLYNDINLDSTAQNSELITSKPYASLVSNDSLIYEYSISGIDTGVKQYIAKVIYTDDNDTLNNKIIRRVNVSSSGSGTGGIVINEIMYDPLTNQSEWIEIYNSSGQSVNLKNWKYKETSTTVTLSSTDLMMNPGDYFILAHDTSIYNNFGYLRTLQSNQHIKFTSSMSLTNTGETITITDSLNNTIDAVSYDPDWNNPNLSDTKGISLERINPGLASNDRSNWSSCAKPEGGTPGFVNSIYTQNITSTSAVTISPNPFSPDGDGYEDFALIKYKLNVPFAQMRVKVYDIKGRLVKTLANNAVTGSEGTIIFNGFDDANQKLRVGIYILIIEAVDDTGGTIDKIKSPIVIATKL